MFKRGKGQMSVVDVMAAVCPGRQHAWLVFVGDGPERAPVERRADEAGLDRVRFVGTVPDARVLDDGFDIVVSASDAEGLPYKRAEAAAAGRPIVATAAGGTPEIVLDGETGLLVPVRDMHGLGRALARLLDDPGLALNLGAAARRHVAKQFGFFIASWPRLRRCTRICIAAVRPDAVERARRQSPPGRSTAIACRAADKVSLAALSLDRSTHPRPCATSLARPWARSASDPSPLRPRDEVGDAEPLDQIDGGPDREARQPQHLRCRAFEHSRLGDQALARPKCASRILRGLQVVVDRGISKVAEMVVDDRSRLQPLADGVAALVPDTFRQRLRLTGRRRPETH